MKINLQNNTHNITSTTHPNLSFYLRETYRICNFLANCCDYARKQYKAPISISPEVYETSSKTGSRIRILYLLTGPIPKPSTQVPCLWPLCSVCKSSSCHCSISSSVIAHIVELRRLCSGYLLADSALTPRFEDHRDETGSKLNDPTRPDQVDERSENQLPCQEFQTAFSS